MKRKNFKTPLIQFLISLQIVSVTCPLQPATAQSVPSVPGKYQTEYAALNQAVDTFITSLDNHQGSTRTATFATKLDSADAGKGLALLQPNAIDNVKKELNLYKKLGVQGVVIHIGFPVLDPQFFVKTIGNANDYNQFVSFYAQVMQLCRKTYGLKVLVESHPLDPSGTNLGPQSYNYCTKVLSNTSLYTAAFARHNANIAQNAAPDILSLVAEPDTDLAWSGQSVYRTPAALASLVQTVTSTVYASGAKQISIAAGAGQWMSNAQDYDDAFYKVQGLTAIDTHIYFAGNNELEAATKLAQNAHNAGKQAVVSECWLTTAGIGTPPATPESSQATAAIAMNSFSFWQPVDEKYMSAFATKWAPANSPTFFCFFYPQLLFAYLDYNQVASLDAAKNYSAIISDERSAEQAAINASQFSPVGNYYAKLLSSVGH